MYIYIYIYISIYVYVQLVHADDIHAIVQHSCKRYSLMIANMCMCVFVAINQVGMSASCMMMHQKA